MAIHLYFTGLTRDKNIQKPTGDELINYILNHNGDIVIDSPIKCTVKFKRNDIWYLTIKFPAKILNGQKLTSESIFKCNLGYIDNQLFRMIYPKYNKKEDTYECYCNHVFFDSRFECAPINTNYKCDNSEDAPYRDRWSWDTCINKLNEIISKSNDTLYKIYGSSPDPKYFNTRPEIGELFYILWKYSQDINRCWDLVGGYGTSGTKIQMFGRIRSDNYHNGFNPAQAFTLTPSKSGIEGEYNIRNYQSYLYTNIEGVIPKDNAPIMIYADSHDGINERFTFKETVDGGSEIIPVVDTKYRISRKDKNMDEGNQLVVLRDSIINKEDKTFVYSYIDYRVDIDFNNQNIIESLFGSSDNSMLKKFNKMINRNHTTAMLNNYSCYFGDMNKYPSYLLPKEIMLSDRQVLQKIVTESTEDRIDAIIPTGMNNKRPPDTDERSLIKSSNYDKNSVHHVAYITYDDLGLTDDGGSIETENALWEALAGRARVDLESNNTSTNKIETTFNIIDIVKNNLSVLSNIKLNDTLHYYNNGTLETYYIEEYTYDIVTNSITDIQLIKKGEL